MTLVVKNVNYSVPQGFKQNFSALKNQRIFHRPFDPSTSDFKKIVRNVSFKVNEGEFVGIIGSSGCGKTSLINVVCNRLYTKTYNGECSLNGKKIGFWAKKAIGYVQQEDILKGTDTVKDSIQFVADMRLPGRDHTRLVDSILNELNLKKVENSIIGNAAGVGFEAGNNKHGISGGERRRTSIGRQLVSGCELLVLDECTSGLDVHTANQIITLLKHLSQQPYDHFSNAQSTHHNLSVLTTIHQPTSQMWQQFDRVLVMKDGEILLNVKPSQFKEDCQKCSISIPEGVNPADWLIELMQQPQNENFIKLNNYYHDIDSNENYEIVNKNVVVIKEEQPQYLETTQNTVSFTTQTSSSQLQQEQNHRISDILEHANPTQNSPEQLVQRNGNEINVANEQITDLSHVNPHRILKVLPTAGQAYNQNRYEKKYSISQHIFVSIYEIFHYYVKYTQPYSRQFLLLYRRSITTLIRNPSMIGRFFLQFTIMGLFDGSLWFNTGYAYSNIQNKIGALFFIELCLVFPPCADASQRWFEKRQLYLSEHAQGLYGTFPFFAAETLADLPIFLVLIIYTTIISYFMVGFNTGFGYCLLLSLEFFFLLVTCMSFSLFTTFLFSSYVASIGVYMITISILVVFSGLYINADNVPAYWIWAMWVSPFFYVFRCQFYLMMEGHHITCGTLKDCPLNQQNIYQLFGMDGYTFSSATWLGFGYMAGWITVFAILDYQCLRYRRFS